MIFRSRNKVRPVRSALINILYRVGVRPEKMGEWFGVSRATVYRHIKR